MSSTILECLTNQVEVIDTSTLRKLILISTSKGNQEKYYDDSEHRYIKMPFEYQGVLWKDYIVEYLSSRLISEEHLLGVEVVQQDIAKTQEGISCVISKDFNFETGTEWVSIHRLLLANGLDIDDKMFPTDRFNLIKDLCLKEYKVDITNYLIVMIVLDYLLLNEDRHLNNFGICRTQEGEFTMAPLFDFGLGLFEHNKIYLNKPLSKALAYVECKPFAKTHDAQIEMLMHLGYGYKIKWILEGLNDLPLELFPSALAYEAYSFQKETIRRRVLEV